MDALTLHRIHFAFTVTFHYIFPQLTMGLALLLVILETRALRGGGEHYHRAARFWAKIFAINFLMGVVTGIPMEFQFGTNWSVFSAAAGGVIGQTLAMEGVFSFFLESSVLGLYLFGEKRLGPKGHWVAAVLLFAGTWLSGYFIVITDAWMQHPVGHVVGPAGDIKLASFWALLLNPWGIWQYLHTMSGAVVTASVVMAAVGALYLLTGRHREFGRTFVTLGVSAGFAASAFMIFPTGDFQGVNIAHHQPATLAGMEGVFRTESGVPLAILGQPDMEKRRLDNPLVVPRVLSFLTYRSWTAEVKGLDAFPPADWPDNVPLLYYSYHIMVGLGTIFVGALAASVWLLRKQRLFEIRGMLWVLLVLAPFPYIANTAGWMTAELGRQPWLVYGLMRTAKGFSPHVSPGSTLFTLLGFMGMYSLLAILFLFLAWREIEHGPEAINGDAMESNA